VALPAEPDYATRAQKRRGARQSGPPSSASRGPQLSVEGVIGLIRKSLKSSAYLHRIKEILYYHKSKEVSPQTRGTIF
jgi:hypothetical protein